jgi:hypothetical protein
MEQKMIINSENGNKEIVILEGPTIGTLEQNKKIKLSQEKLYNTKNKGYKKPTPLGINEVIEPEKEIVKEEVIEKEPDTVVEEYKFEEPVIEPVIEKPVIHNDFSKDDRINNVVNSTIDNSHAYTGTNYSAKTSYMNPDIKSHGNTLNVEGKIKKLMAEANEADETTILGQVLLGGVSRIEAVKKEIEGLDIKTSKINEVIERLMNDKGVAQRENKKLEDSLSRTQKIDLGEIRNAIALRAVDSINKGIEELEGQKIKSDKNIDEIDGKIADQNEEKTLLEEEKKNKQNELYEVCRDVEQQKQLANEYIKKQDKVSKEQEELNELYSNMTLVKEYNSPSVNDDLLKEEEPKKVVNISNPFDRIRDLEEPITSKTTRH